MLFILPKRGLLLNFLLKKRIILRHKNSIERFGYTPAALFWSSKEIQEIRFKQFSNYLSFFTSLKKTLLKILDVGCGFGDLKFFLEEKGFNIIYTGVDISPDMVFSGTKQSPGLDLRAGELVDFNFAKGQFDLVFLSGALN